ncbi:MAG: hypothetical protein ACRDRI_01545 [Pseudonocardiaceae bacterium]
MLPGPTTQTALLDKHKLAARRYVLATLHRPENVDHSPSPTIRPATGWTPILAE